jgi:hypothetical protein
MYKVENCSNMFIVFLWMTGYSSCTEIQNLSRDRSVNQTAAHKVLRLSRWFRVRAPLPGTHLYWNGGRIMFNFLPQFFKVVFNKTQGFLLSFFILKPQQQWKHCKILFLNMIFPMIEFTLKFKDLVTWNQKNFLEDFADTCSTLQNLAYCFLESNPAIHLWPQTPY